MKIGHFDAVCQMGENIEEIFENLLNKISHLAADYKDGEEMLYTGKMGDEEFAAKISQMIERYPHKNETHLITIGAQEQNGFASSTQAISFDDAIQKAKAIVSENKRVLLFASHRATNEEISAYIEDGKYSHGVAKPFDIDADGLNVSDGAAIIELCHDGKYDFGDFDEQESGKIEYVHTCANGVRGEYEKLSNALAKLFTQSALIGSPVGATGQCGSATDTLSLAILCAALKEEILPASSMLEHAFTNELNFAYANKMKRLKNTLFVDTVGSYYALADH